MNFLLCSLLVLSVAVMMASGSSTSDNFSQSKKCNTIEVNKVKTDICDIVADYDFQNDSECYKATYFKKADAEVAQCTKTPCGGATVTADCSEAFRQYFSEIAKE